MIQENRWMRWAVRLQSLAQAGLTYGKDVFDRERYTEIREIAAEMMADAADRPVEQIRDLFCGESGYQTPKLDTRAAIFRDDRILLVREKDGRWSLPGGWVDVELSVAENTVKEVREEAGLTVTADRLIAVQDRARHNLPLYAYGVCKIFVYCTLIGGEFEENSETDGFDWFAENSLPALAEEKNNAEQIALCFAAHRQGDDFRVQFE